MPAPIASPDVWKAVRTASIKGVSDSQLSDYFSVTIGAIQSRRFDDPEWKAAKKDQQPHRTNNQSKKVKTSDPQQVAQHIEAVSALSLAEIGERSSILLARYGHEKLKTAVEEDSIPAPQTWSEVKTVMEVVRKSTGQDKEQQPLTLNLFGSASFMEPEGSTLEAVVENLTPESDDFC